jgi:hypothetical protein
MVFPGDDGAKIYAAIFTSRQARHFNVAALAAFSRAAK